MIDLPYTSPERFRINETLIGSAVIHLRQKRWLALMQIEHPFRMANALKHAGVHTSFRQARAKQSQDSVMTQKSSKCLLLYCYARGNEGVATNPVMASLHERLNFK